MAGTEPYRIQTISELHRLIGLPGPEHPLISVINLEAVNRTGKRPGNRVFDFYAIALKRHCNGIFKYGQQQYEFRDGIMYFMAPGQVFAPIIIDEKKESKMSGWMLYIHPDFLWNTPLAKAIRKYEYFDYSVNEALSLTEKEEAIIIGLMQNIQMEYHANMDKFSQDIIISQIETLLNYSDRFYHRQFLTRKIENHQILDRLEDMLTNYFNSTDLLTRGLPSVQFIAEKLNISPNYLGSLLKMLTGRNTQQHIQDKMIEKAKEKISTTELSVSEISHELGFDHPQSFSRLFKAKTGLSPLAFRQTFN
ncbi:transcriptional regulator, AraC family [Mucilaginibacter frigoritolerans]|jgi:AraC family transcriptional regulator, transcriptional activator of pobA|uniref:Transcriptional regulator, AraC family n=1 Tax=Mucilaginibacter frigoritolerans TaxID=652788 RepID=A0A562TZK7_9SPHI|nr:helix-turn-helix transcriptional regulator [Mucilaginibacter frigoritolerans]TWI98678.1 transcriptional regulator, AraC family [Mucilaginibacter frigoritolerans]